MWRWPRRHGPGEWRSTRHRGRTGSRSEPVGRPGGVAGTLLTPLAAGLVGSVGSRRAGRVRIASGAAVVGGDGGGVERGQCRGHRAGRRRGMGGAAIRKGGAGAEEEWEISLRLRGQAGQRCRHARGLAGGEPIRLLDGAVTQVDLPASARGLARHWRVGPARRALDDPSYVERVLAFDGIGLRPLAAGAPAGGTDGGDLDLSWIRRGGSMPTAGPASTCRWARRRAISPARRRRVGAAA
jgi:hypothetical protein